MRKSEMIKEVKWLLNNINQIKTEIQERKLKGYSKSINEFRLRSLIRSLQHLPIEYQQLVAYRYFEKKSCTEAALLLNISTRTLTRWDNEIILRLGRLMNGPETELIEKWDKILA